MATGSALAIFDSGCCFCQYWITMAMLAAPHPSSSSFTKGTSSHTPEAWPAKAGSPARAVFACCGGKAGSPAGAVFACCGGKAMPQRLKSMIRRRGMSRNARRCIANGNDNQNQREDRQDDQDQVAIANSAGGEISLGFISPRRKLCQLLIVQCGDGGSHLLRI